MLPKTITEISSFVNDFSKILSSEDQLHLDNTFVGYKETTTIDAITVLFPHRDGLELKDIGVALFNATGIGEAGKNNGILLLISTDEKKIRLVVGKGLEWIFTNYWCQRTIEDKLRPLMNQGKYKELIESFYKELKHVQSDTLGSTKQKNNLKNTRTLYNHKAGVFDVKALYILLFIGGFFTSGILTSVLQRNYPLFIFGAIIVLGFILYAYGYLKNTEKSKITKNDKVGMIILICIFCLLIFGIVKSYNNPAPLQTKTSQNQSNTYKKNTQKTSPSYNRSSSKSSSSSRSSSSRSSYSGGGGSTNGAGYGD